ncbi:MAG TPA: hypothetical protein VG184_03095 [Acidimicrobiales bacterium]|jgi:hypothetical protein|nr:hypothetical protein [Acidimicrobiales bacterium]
MKTAAKLLFGMLAFGGLSACGGSSPKPLTASKSTTTATTATTSGSSTTSVAGGSTPTSAPNLSKVVGNGKHYSFSQAVVPTQQWPDACALLPAASISALFGISQVKTTPMPAAGYTAECDYQVGPQESGFAVGVHVNQVGSGEASQTYQSNLQTDSNYQPTSVPGIGTMANIYQNGASSATIDVLSGPVEYSLTVISYAIDHPVPTATIQGDAKALGKAIAPEFA